MKFEKRDIVVIICGVITALIVNTPIRMMGGYWHLLAAFPLGFGFAVMYFFIFRKLKWFENPGVIV